MSAESVVVSNSAMVEFAALATMGVHSLVVLPGTGTLAKVVYRKAGMGVLRRAWIKLDLI